MEIRKVPVSNINSAPYNPRVDLRPGDPEYEKLKRSIAEFGYVEPLVWNGTYRESCRRPPAIKNFTGTRPYGNRSIRG
ncbi:MULTISPECIES: ParB N-terminal domain-containing protein [Aneurinibacillus]|uniref:hypothetical protein n=1 Tax=Aneurinibacillus TaxID=55079 RepID=UPI002ADE111B|nr:hypothetical protein [Aneurinibacillus thermoaerophilus]